MKRERQVCRYIRTGLGFRLPRNLKFSVRLYRALVFKIFKISGVNLDFRGVKKRQGGWGKKFSYVMGLVSLVGDKIVF
jgi:hypothetical protein